MKHFRLLMDWKVLAGCVEAGYGSRGGFRRGAYRIVGVSHGSSGVSWIASYGLARKGR